MAIQRVNVYSFDIQLKSQQHVADGWTHTPSGPPVGQGGKPIGPSGNPVNIQPSPMTLLQPIGMKVIGIGATVQAAQSVIQQQFGNDLGVIRGGVQVNAVPAYTTLA